MHAPLCQMPDMRARIHTGAVAHAFVVVSAILASLPAFLICACCMDDTSVCLSQFAALSCIVDHDHCAFDMRKTLEMACLR